MSKPPSWTIGNVCPARLDADVFAYLPHRPVLYSDGGTEFLIPVDPRAWSTGVALKVCVYCGSLYAESIAKATEAQ